MSRQIHFVEKMKETNDKSRNFQEKLLQDDVKSALSSAKRFDFIRFVLAIVLSAAYFLEWSFFSELLTFSVILLLFVPMGFRDTYLAKLTEYNTTLVENRQMLNAEEANIALNKAFEDIDCIKKKIEYIEEDAEETNESLTVVFESIDCIRNQIEYIKKNE